MTESEDITEASERRTVLRHVPDPSNPAFCLFCEEAIEGEEGNYCWARNDELMKGEI